MPVARKTLGTDAVNIFIIVAIGALICLPTFVYGAPNGHSIIYNLVWLREFSAQLAGGELYPRWLLDVNEGAGSPAFFFYAPVPFYIVSFGAALCSSCDITIKLAVGQWLLFTFSGITFYVFAREIANSGPAIFSALLYLLLPYHLEIDLWHRQAMGEFSAYIWMPLILLFTRRISRGENAITGLALTYGLLIASHLPAALLFSVCLVIYAATLPRENGSATAIRRFVVGVTLGILLSGIYLVPALFMQQHISTEYWRLPHLAFHRWFFLDGNDEPDSIFGARVFAVVSLTTLMFGILWAIGLGRGHRNRFRELLPWLLIVVFAWFLMSPLSRPLWEFIPLLQKIQFPYRVVIAIDLAVAATAIYALQSVFDSRRLPALLGIGLCVVMLGYSMVTGSSSAMKLLTPNHDQRRLTVIDQAMSSGAGPREYVPPWAKTPRIELRRQLSRVPRLSFDASAGLATVTQWQPRQITIDVDLRRKTDLVIRQFYYPGWVAKKISAQPISLESGPTEPTGLVRISAPSGQYTIVLNLEPGWQERVGRLLTGVTVLLVLVMRVWPRWTQRPGTK